ncbi:MAG: hypothetical protein GWO02_14145 [Gammaproteobacteria bacterium]|nr:hypothetical protein [Gammaproteobacteria bacterium]
MAPPEAWLTRVSLFLPGRLGLTSPKSFSDVVHRRYYEQAACLYRLLDKVMRAAERSPLARRFVVIVHGDHGSKIHAPLPLTDALDDLSRHDLVQNYATLFAVRAPAIAPGYDSEQRAVQELVATLVENDFLSLASAGESSGEAFVYVSATADPLSYGARKVPISDFEAADPPARP